MGIRENLEAMLARGHDGALLRFSLAGEYLKAGDAARAVDHALEAVRLDTGYSAAWKLLGKAQVAAGDPEAARLAYRKGIAVAEDKGDLQAAKEMRVYLKRLNPAGSTD